MSDLLRLPLDGPIPGRLDVSFDAISAIAVALASTVDGVATSRPGDHSKEGRRPRPFGRSSAAAVSAEVTRSGSDIAVGLTVDAWWGTPLAELTDRLRRRVADGLNGSLGTSWGPEVVVVRFGEFFLDRQP